MNNRVHPSSAFDGALLSFSLSPISSVSPLPFPPSFFYIYDPEDTSINQMSSFLHLFFPIRYRFPFSSYFFSSHYYSCLLFSTNSNSWLFIIVGHYSRKLMEIELCFTMWKRALFYFILPLVPFQLSFLRFRDFFSIFSPFSQKLTLLTKLTTFLWRSNRSFTSGEV